MGFSWMLARLWEVGFNGLNGTLSGVGLVSGFSPLFVNGFHKATGSLV